MSKSIFHHINLTSISHRSTSISPRKSASSRHKSASWQGGFSLIELLIYIAILGAVSGIAVGILTTITKTQVQESAMTDVSGQLGFVTQTIQRLVTDSSVIDMNAGVASSTLKLRMPNLVNDPTYVYLSNGQVYIQQGTNSPQSITSASINIDSLQFKKISQAPGKDTVQIDIAASAVQKAAGTTISRALRTAVARVNAATFDSDLLPNTDNAYSVGANPSSRWLNGAFSGNLTVGGNVGIGTTNPSAMLTLSSATAGGATVLATSINTNVYSKITNDGNGGFIDVGRNNSGNNAGMRIYTAGSLDWVSGAYSGVPTGGFGFYNTTVGNVLTLTSLGNVGIGTTTPQGVLDVESGTNTYGMILNGSGTGQTAFRLGNSTTRNYQLSVGGSSNATPYFYIYDEASSTRRLVIDNNGNVGIGTTTPGAALDIFGNSTNVSARILSGSTSNIASFNIGRTSTDSSWGVAATVGQWATDASPGDVVLRTQSTSQRLILNSGAGASTLVVSNGNVGIGTTTPTTAGLVVATNVGGASIDAGSNRIINVATPTASTDAANKAYVDAAAAGGSSFNGHYATCSASNCNATVTCNTGTVIVNANGYCNDTNHCSSVEEPIPSCYGLTTCSQSSYLSNFANIGIVCGK